MLQLRITKGNAVSWSSAPKESVFVVETSMPNRARRFAVADEHDEGLSGDYYDLYMALHDAFGRLGIRLPEPAEIKECIKQGMIRGF